MIHSLSLKSKLILSFLFIALLIPCVALLNFISTKQVSSQYDQVAQLNNLSTDVLGAFNSLARDLLLNVVSINLPPASEKQNNEYITKVEEIGQKFTQVDQIYSSNNLEGQEKGAHGDLVEKWTKVYSSAKKLTELAQRTTAEETQTFKLLMQSEFIPQIKNYFETYSKLTDIINSKSEVLIHNAEETAKFGSWLSVGATGLGFIVAILLSWILSRSVSNQLVRVITYLQKESTELNSSSVTIRNASQVLSASVNQQTSFIDRTVSSMEEMSSMLAKTSQQTILSSQISEKNSRSAEASQVTFEKLFSAIEDIQRSNSQLDQINKIIDEIKNKTDVINDIVLKTSLLSFNASIEAARAGAHGKGFAVVADEVGKLAVLSGTAASEIGSLLENSTTEVGKVIKEIQVKVVHGKEISNEACKSFQEISSSLKQINESIRSIEDATQQQNIGIQQTNKAMGEMNQSNQMNSQNTELLAQQSVKLHAFSSEVKNTIDQLNHIVFGRKVLKLVQNKKEEQKIKINVSPEHLDLNQQLQNEHARRVS